MKKIKVMAVSLIALMALVNAQVKVYAEGEESPDTSKLVKSKGDVIFKIDNSGTDPLDPTDPDIDKPIVPTDPDTPEGTSGPLSIDHVSNFHFGEQLISPKAQIYYAALEEVKQQDETLKAVPNYVQVTDKRGSNEGWLLTVKQEKQLATDDGTELKGAVIKLSNTQIKTTSDNKAKVPTVTTDIELIPAGNALDVISAKQEEGMGLWIGSFGNESTGANSVSLSVPGESAKQASKYTSELTWTLSSAPI
ncbi:WxL domain-containing protein [Listeria monocytogenes]|nr:WxL domain-containing protein [Listeria monocytogenes]EIT6516565.1 WxL domain-containing protein [Listeria monocytogenes]EJQ1760386.1 WxL domain-containing protein [Listeria monocytogenes]